MPDIPVIVEQMRDIAKPYGWAVGVHGSLIRDIDLIVVPWVSTASYWHVVYDAWFAVLSLRDTEGDYRYRRPQRAYGRKSMLILQKSAIRVSDHPKGEWAPPAIDVSFMIPVEHLEHADSWTNPRIST